MLPVGSKFSAVNIVHGAAYDIDRSNTCKIGQICLQPHTNKILYKTQPKMCVKPNGKQKTETKKKTWKREEWECLYLYFGRYTVFRCCYMAILNIFSSRHGTSIHKNDCLFVVCTWKINKYQCAKIKQPRNYIHVVCVLNWPPARKWKTTTTTKLSNFDFTNGNKVKWRRRRRRHHR